MPDFPTSDPNFVYEIDNPEEFVDWLRENHPELIGEISEKTVCNGTGHEWTYYTTNKPFDSQEWIKAVAEYEEYMA